MTDDDRQVLLAMSHFLAWNDRTIEAGERLFEGWAPAVFAYALGASSWCPPAGTL